MRWQIVSALVLIATAAAGLDRDPAGYERILVPVVSQARPGAFGSRWRTELTVRNEADVPAHVFQQECSFFCSCSAMVLCTAGEIPPHHLAIGAIAPARNPSNVGAFIYVNRRLADDLAIQLRVRDISRDAENWGTEIPVVRDRNMRRAVTRLLDVPLTAGFRQHLRVYGASSPSGEGDLVVRFYAKDGTDVLAERVVTLLPGTLDRQPDRLPTDDQLPEVPAYAEITSLASIVGTEIGVIRLEITPLTTGLKYWAMVSVTNNSTQQVTLITPQ